jgi:16S rRNA processing protein RimM
MKTEDCFLLGHVAKTHGFKGEVSVKIDSDDPFAYDDIEAFFIEIHGNLTPFFTKYFKLNNKGIAKTQLEGIDTEEGSRMLLGNKVYLPLAALPPLKGNKFYYHEIMGFKVIDKLKGEIGIVQDVMEHSTQSIIVIDFNNTEILVPITDETIVKVNRKDSILEINAPEGLIDIYL